MALELLIFLFSLIALSYPLSYVNPDNVNMFSPVLLFSMIVLGAWLYRRDRVILVGLFPIFMAAVLLMIIQHNEYFLVPGLLVIGFVISASMLPSAALAYAIPAMLVAALLAWPVYYMSSWVIAVFLGFMVLSLSWFLVPDKRYLIGAVATGTLLAHYVQN